MRKIEGVSGRSQADPRSHVVVQLGRPKTIRAAAEISRLRFIRTEIRNLREADLPHLLSQSRGFEKALLWFATSLRSRQNNGENFLCLLIY